MFVNPELHGKKRQEQLDESAKKATREHEEAKRTLGSPRYHQKAGNALRASHGQTGVAALRLYSFLAEHIDPACGAVVADQQFLADKMGVNRSTIIRWLNYLESKNAFSSKDYAAFVTKTLVRNNDGEIQRKIMAMFFRSGESGQEQKHSDS